MRSAQTPFGIWAIMKKFIYMCNDYHYMFGFFDILSITIKYEQIVNMKLIYSELLHRCKKIRYKIVHVVQKQTIY